MYVERDKHCHRDKICLETSMDLHASSPHKCEHFVAGMPSVRIGLYVECMYVFMCVLLVTELLDVI
jgi:hypothetical protein